MLHLFVHQYLFLKCITEFLHGNYHWVFLWFCRLYSDGLALGVWFMTSCCCLVEFGFSCFNHASIESWFANYSVLDILHWKVNLSHLTQNDVSYGLECNTTGHFCNRGRGPLCLNLFFLFASADKYFTCCFAPLFVLITHPVLEKNSRDQQKQHESFHCLQWMLSVQTHKLLQSLSLGRYQLQRTGVTNHHISNIIHQSEHLLCGRLTAGSVLVFYISEGKAGTCEGQ